MPSIRPSGAKFYPVVSPQFFWELSPFVWASATLLLSIIDQAVPKQVAKIVKYTYRKSMLGLTNTSGSE